MDFLCIGTIFIHLITQKKLKYSNFISPVINSK
ncbi:hypothetical protein SAMN05216503_1410 [Polaribacter sp. KT25b]|nr:hypothetical protein SAMN05216503_1410 [Polaribacter sp. KT25b]